jgi:beta-lactamase regulating signal transducer with metallopeptidase domain
MNSFDAGIALALEPGFCLRLTQTLLYFAGQGLVIGLVALAANWSLQGASSRLRYSVNVMALALMLGCLPATFACLPAQAPSSGLRTGGSDVQVLVAETMAAEEAPAEGKARSTRPVKGSSLTAHADVEDAATQPLAWARPRGTSALEPVLRAFAPATAVVYLLGVSLMLLRVSVALWGGHRLGRSAAPVEDWALLTIVARQAHRLGMRTAPAVAWCQRVSVPVVVGLARPLVLLPTSLASGLSLDQMEALLTHELAHIRRYDLLVNLLQRLAESLLFFHPAVWYVSRQVSIEREKCCDDLVVATGCGRLQYADALVRMAELCAALQVASPVHQAALLAASGNEPSQFKRRVLHLVDVDGGPKLRLTRGTVLLTVLLPVAILVAPALVPGETDRPPIAMSGARRSPAPSLAVQEAEGIAASDAGQAPSIRHSAVAIVEKSAASNTSLAVEELAAALSHENEAVNPFLRGPTRGEGDERLALFMFDLVDGGVTMVAREPKPDFTYCGSPSWSHDGRRVLFDATPGTVWSKTHLQVLEAVDGRARLTDLGLGNCPSLSPNGKRIAFLFNAASSSQQGVWIMQADGSGRRRLGGYGVPRWSPDGRQLLVTSFGTPCEATLMRDNGIQRPVRLAGYEFRSVPHWAGDGATLIATLRSAAGFDIALIDISQPEQARIKQVLWRKGSGPAVDPRHPAWSGSCPAPAYQAASGRCVFVGWDKNGAALYTLQAGQLGPPQRLEAGYDNKIASLAFSPDGRYLLFCSDRHEQGATIAKTSR